MALFVQGYCFVAGLDEAGRGCLAGPVVAAAVILPLAPPTEPGADIAARLLGVNDSKQLNEATRERLYDVVMLNALSVGVGIGSVEVIDERNILQATKYAMC
ncbi:MAG TPA: ribonuclease HII, partial [Ktedonobacteraceae bacterium]|nr:ribonuclease HII [Ktedonobacteraceae bacterium]